MTLLPVGFAALRRPSSGQVAGLVCYPAEKGKGNPGAGQATTHEESGGIQEGEQCAGQSGLTQTKLADLRGVAKVTVPARFQ
jgi:hypothetical protein